MQPPDWPVGLRRSSAPEPSAPAQRSASTSGRKPGEEERHFLFTCEVRANQLLHRNQLYLLYLKPRPLTMQGFR